MRLDANKILTLPMAEVEAECSIHGKFAALVMVIDGKERPAECAVCTREAIRKEQDAESLQAVKRLTAARRASKIARMELPDRFITAKWSDYTPPNEKAFKFHSICQEYADKWPDNSSNGNITMVGKTGTGKTYLACMIAKQAGVNANADSLYTTVSRLSRYVRGSFSKHAKYTQAEAVNRYIDLDLLVLDEVGLTLSSSFERGLLDEIIDERSMRRAATILISNLSIGELEGMAERMIDRMSENGTLMVFDWDSYRGRT